MTITTLPARNEYTSTAGQTIFNYDFKIYVDTDLDVYVTPAGQDANDAADITTDYVVDVGTIGDENGGFITFNSPLNAGDLVTIVSAIPFNRTVDYQNNGDFIPTTVNGDNDRQVSQIKQNVEGVGRSIVWQESQQNVQSLTYPTSDRSDTVLGFDNTGNPIFLATTDTEIIGSISTELVGLISGQTTVNFSTVDATLSEFYMVGNDTDQGRLVETVNYTVTDATTIELTESYPAGSAVLGRQRI